MSKTTHFDIGAWPREKATRQQEIIAKNHTISELNESIVEKPQQIKDLKRKVGLFIIILCSTVDFIVRFVAWITCTVYNACYSVVPFIMLDACGDK